MSNNIHAMKPKLPLAVKMIALGIPNALVSRRIQVKKSNAVQAKPSNLYAAQPQ